jgi:cell division protein FtsZ
MSKTGYIPSRAKIKVIGAGGAGCNAITRMVREQIRGVEFIAMNTDAAHLEITEAPVRIALGERLTHGLGAGGDQNVGRKSAEEASDEIKQALIGADMVFLAAGMGGGTGTGSIAVVAEVAKRMGALTIAIITKPFSFEGNRRTQLAEEGINQLIGKVDTLIIIPNDKLLELADNKTAIDDAFKLADEILCQAVEAIANVITVPGLVNLDFADIRSIMKDSGPAWMSVGRGSGPNRAVTAAKEALASPLLDVSITGAKGVLLSVCGGNSLTIFEVRDAAKIIGEAVDPEANIIFGVNIDPNMGNEVRLTLIATGSGSGNKISGKARETAINKSLSSLKTEADLDTPAYTRYESIYKRQIDKSSKLEL